MVASPDDHEAALGVALSVELSRDDCGQHQNVEELM